jgi:hypothetical protein
MRLYILAVLAAVSSFAGAQTFAPPLVETGGLNTAFRNAPRAYQSFIDSTQLAGLTQPTFITGISLRLMSASLGSATTNPPADWPSQTLNFSDFTVRIGSPSAAIVTAGEIPVTTTTFNQNFGADVVTARSGALSLSTGAFGFNPSSTPAAPNPWGPTITFTTPFLYTPGQDLIYAISHSGYAPAGEFQPFFSSGDYANSVADAVSSTTSSSLDAAPGGFSSPYLVQFTTEPIPEPATMTVLALGAVAALRRRNRKA